jgi:hypothetical protein
MARIFMDGFECGADYSWWTSRDGATISSSSIPVGFSGTYYASCGTDSSLEKVFSTTYSELYFAFKYYSSNTISNVIMSIKDSGGTIIFSLTRNLSTLLLEARRGTYNATIMATGTTQIQTLKTYLIEIRYKPLDSGGVVTIKIDGVQDINFSGDSTAGLEAIQSFRLGGLGGGVNGYGNYDDIVVDDANWIGNTKLGIIIPNGTGTTNNWTASAGTAYQCIDEIPPVDTDYVYSNTTNQIATYAMTTIASMNSVKAVQLQGRAAYEGSPTPTKIQLGVRASAADYFATDLSPGISFGMLTKILELNPADSAAWEQADIDALEVGVKATA